MSELPSSDDLSTKTPEQIGGMLSALSVTIGFYGKSVANAEERYRKDREFLAGLMAEFTRLSHYTVRCAAIALEQDCAASVDRSGEADETRSGSAEGESAVTPKAADAQTSAPTSCEGPSS